MILLAQNRVSQCRTIASTIRDVIAPLTKLKITQGDIAPLPQPLEFGMILPDLVEIVSINSTQLDMTHLNTWDDDTIGTHRQLAHGPAAPRETTPSTHALSSLLTGLFHLKPRLSFGERPSLCVDTAVVFPVKSQERLHCQEAILWTELDFLCVIPAEAHKRGGVGGKTWKTDLFQQEPGDIFKIFQIVFMNSHPDTHRQTMSPEDLDALHGTNEIPLAPAGIMYLGC